MKLNRNEVPNAISISPTPLDYENKNNSNNLTKIRGNVLGLSKLCLLCSFCCQIECI